MPTGAWIPRPRTTPISAPSSSRPSGNAAQPGAAGAGGGGRVVGERRDGRVGCEHEPVVDGLELVLLDEAREQRVVPAAAQEAGRADHLVGAVDALLDREALREERLVPLSA